jgi:hypothetical protein
METTAANLDRHSARTGRRPFPVRVLVLLAIAMLSLAGCEDDECTVCVDQTPPPVPTGVFTVAGDGYVIVYWNASVWEEEYSDLAAYYIYSTYEAAWDADLFKVGEVAWDENLTGDGLSHYYTVTEVYDPAGGDWMPVLNGVDHYFAVASIDTRGNLSDPSWEQVREVPRPEGFGLEIADYGVDPAHSGFDFSRLGAGLLDPTPPTTADIRVVYDRTVPEQPVPYVESARAGVALQDYGLVHLDWVLEAPLEGWSATGRLELIEGHSYVVLIDDGEIHYAKFAVIDVDLSTVEVDWAYQAVDGERQLAVPDPGKPLAGDFTPIRF